MKVANFNGCKVYNLSTGKTMPDWLSQSKKRALQKDEEYRKRLELIQEFEMTTAAQCITMSKDMEHIIVTGTYPPVVKCFTTNDLSMKFQRGLTAEVVSMQSLSDDFGKLVFLQNDRTINLHAPYGTHYSLRIPKFGRHMVYNWDNCDLCIGTSGNEIYRLNLESGQFREPFTLSFEGCNKIHINPVHQLLAAGGDNGNCEFWDPRQRSRVSYLEIHDKDIANPNNSVTNITTVKFDSDGLTFGAGTSNGNCYIYDIRSKKPLYTKEHQYGLPIVDISYHHSSKSIITTDKKIVKIWERQAPSMGKIITNIETPSEINDILFVNDRRGETGLIMIPGEQSRIMTYFIPQLGPAPRWCSFLENLTEELEEQSSSNLYEDYKFITKQELEELGATSLLGTPMLKAYMHGFFIEMKLYNKLRAVSKPFEYEEYRKQKITEKIEKNRGSRISVTKKLPKINQEFAEKLIQKQLKDEKKLKKQEEEEEEDDDGGEEHAPAPVVAADNKKRVVDAKKLIDPRFAAIFEREEFQRDENDYEYQLRYPVKGKFSKSSEGDTRKSKYADEDDEDHDNLFEEIEEEVDEAGNGHGKRRYADADDDDDDDDEDGDDFDGEGDDPRHYNELVSDDDEAGGERYQGEYDNDDDDDYEDSNKQKKKKRKFQGADDEEMGAIAKASMKAKMRKLQQQQNNNFHNKKNDKKMFTLNESITSNDILFSNKQQLKSLRKEERVLANLPIQERLKQQQQQQQQQGQGHGQDKNPFFKKKGGKFNKKFNDHDQPQIKSYKSQDQGLIREISFFPKGKR